MESILGIDIGGTGVKGALVNIKTGKLLTEKIKFRTPDPSTPKAVIKTIKEIIKIHNWKNKPFGLCFPSVIKKGVVLTASNIDKSWINYKIEKTLEKEIGAPLIALNDADSAGVAEMKFGIGKGKKGTVIMLTLGTGIGSGLFLNGNLIPNTELGHLKYKKSVWEHYASNRARESKNLSWKAWGGELNKFLQHIEFIINPDLIILGGGVSKEFNKYNEFIQISTPVEIAKMLNDAGVIGAAFLAGKKFGKPI